MAHTPQSSEESLSEVNVIPLADLSLVLLIILMVMSPMITQALIQVQAGQATAALTREDLEQPETPLIVTYTPGHIFFNGHDYQSPLDFVQELDQLMPTRKDKSILLTADPALQHGDVVALMDVLQHRGASTLTLVKWNPAEAAQQMSGAHPRA